eukprot:1046454-Pleurochrysis_carterae.AAC.1
MRRLRRSESWVDGVTEDGASLRCSEGQAAASGGARRWRRCGAASGSPTRGAADGWRIAASTAATTRETHASWALAPLATGSRGC